MHDGSSVHATAAKIDISLEGSISMTFCARSEVEADDTIRVSLSIRYSILYKIAGKSYIDRLTWNYSRPNQK